MEHFVFKKSYYNLYKKLLEEDTSTANTFLIDLINYAYEGKHINTAGSYMTALVEVIDFKELDDNDLYELNEY